MTMTIFDGFDWYGDNEQDSNTILAELNSRGWVPRGDVEAEVLDPSPIWEDDDRYQPPGRAIKLTGAVGGHLMWACKPWIDTAVGFNVIFETVPAGGPHKVLEIVQWNGSYNVLYTLALLNGRFYSYAYGEVGVGSPLQDGTTFFMGAVEAGRTYSLHYYGRRSLRVLWVDGRVEGYWGGYSGLTSNHIIRVYNTGSPTIDDAYLTHTQPERWPGAWDTLLPYDYIDEDGDGALYRHKVITPKPVTELVNEWNLEGGSLADCIKGGDDAFIWVDATLKKGFATHNEDVDFPSPPLYNYHTQGFCTAEREGSIKNAMHFEGRHQEFDSGVAIMPLVSYWIHNDTVVLGWAGLDPPPRDLARLTNKVTAISVRRQLTSTPEELNKIDWWGRTFEKPPVFGSSF